MKSSQERRSFFCFIKSLLKPRVLQFNYIFFFSLYIILLCLNFLHHLSIPSGTFFEKIYFLLHSFGQTSLIFSALLAMSLFVKKYLTKPVYLLYIAAVCLFFAFLVSELVLVKIMDISLAEGLDVVFSADIANFIELIYLTDIGVFTWVLFFLGLVILPLFGVLFYRMCDKLSRKISRSCSLKLITYPLFAIPLGLFSLDFLVSKSMPSDVYAMHKKALPFNATFFEQSASQILVKKSDHFNQHSKGLFEKIKGIDVYAESKPNLYFFVVETLRDDFLKQDIASNILKFKKDTLFPEKGVASANGTHLAWFSLFNAHEATSWSYQTGQLNDHGSLCLSLLKKMGYQIHTLSAAELSYFGMKKSIFGKNQKLSDSFFHLYHGGNVNAELSDIAVMDQLGQFLEKKENQKNQAFIVFLDSTHFNYSWPSSLDVPYPNMPEVSLKNYLTSSQEDIEHLKGRYRNAIYFIDKIFGEFITSLKNKGLYDEAVIALTGDHGEEFFEEGKLFHASHLSKFQLNVPIFLKLGTYRIKNRPSIAAHVDMFPTLFHYLFCTTEFDEYFDGKSLLGANKPKMALSARFQGGRSPDEFVLTDGKNRLHCSLKKSYLYRSEVLTLLWLETGEKKFKPTKKQAEKIFPEFFKRFQLKL